MSDVALTDSDILTQWFRELATVHRPPDPTLIGTLEHEATARGLNLTAAATTLLAARFNPDLHPRGKDGKFIEKLGIVKLLNTGDLSNRRARVEAIEPDPRSPGNPNIRVRLLDEQGQPGPSVTVKPANVEQAPEKARLNLSQRADLEPQRPTRPPAPSRPDTTEDLETVTGQPIEPGPPGTVDGPPPPAKVPPGPWEPSSQPRPAALSRVGDRADEHSLRRYARENDVPPGTRVAFTIDNEGRITGGEEWFDSGEELPTGHRWAWIDIADDGTVTSEPRAKTLEERRADIIADVNAKAATLSTTDAVERSKGLDEILAKLRFSIVDTDQVHDRISPPEGDGGRWTAERHTAHEEMWDELLTNVEAAGIPQDRDAFVLGGLPGAGKSSVLRPGGPAEAFGVVAWEPGTDIPEGTTHVSINPDIVKEMLIDRGMLPEGISPDLKPMEQVTFLHEESSYLAKQFSKRLGDLGYNIVLDNTMDSEHGMLKRMTPLARQGYTFRGLFVDIPVDESRASAKARYERGAFTEKGGRFVPSSVMGNRTSTRGTMSKNRDAMDDLVADDWFTEWQVIDNTGISQRTPRSEVVAQGTGNGSAVAKWQGDLEVEGGIPPAANPAAPAVVPAVPPAVPPI